MIGVLWRYFREPPGRPHPRARAPGGQLLGTVGAALPRLPARHPQVAAEYEALKRRLDVRYGTTAGATPRPRSRSRGRSSAGPTGGPRPRVGSAAPATPDQLLADRPGTS